MIDVLAQNHPNGQFSALFHGLASEMKVGNNAWENACSRAAKLATQLGATAGALGHFVEALQAVSDSANNVNGISRDIGAALTRFCIRQRAVGQGLRAWGQSLNGQFSVDLERKCGEWRQTVAESERRHQKTCKRIKGKPKQIMENESRNAFVELLHAQRNQFIGFIDALLPIICAQLGMLEEGTHVRQVKDSMEAALNQNDPNALVQALLEDINCAPGPGPISPSVSTNRTVEEQKMWDQRVGLGLASSRAKSASQIGLFPMANGGTENGMETPMENGIGTYSQLYGTFGGQQNTSNSTVGHRNSMPPPATNDGRPSSQQQQHFWTPPYPHSNQFPSSSSSAAFPIQNGSNNFGQFDNRPKSIPNGPSTTPLVANVRHHRPPLPDAFIHSSSTQNAANSSIKSAQNSPTKLQQKRQRPFEMDAINSSTAIQFRPIGAFSSASPHSHSALATNSSNCSIQTLDSASISIHSAEIQPKIERLPPTNIGQQIGGIGNQSQRPLSLGAAMMDSVDGSATTSTSSAALIAETLQQIDRLGLELDNYCDGLEENAENSNIKNGQRKETIMGMRHLPQPPPPPPPPLPPSIPMDPSFSISTIQNQFTSIRFRPDSLPPMANNGIGNGQCHPQKFPPPPPPLPERRNSSISSATPTAPSIAEIRSAALVRPSNNSHQQSASTPIFCAQQGMPPAIPPQPPSFRHPPTPMASSGPSIHFGQYQNYQNGK